MQEAVDRKLSKEEPEEAIDTQFSEFKNEMVGLEYVPPIKPEGKVDPGLIHLTKDKRLQKIIPQEIKQQEILYQLKEKRKDELKQMLQKDIEKARDAQLPEKMKKKLEQDEMMETGYGDFDEWVNSMDLADKKHFLNKIKNEQDHMMKEIEKQ